ncbi:hypothetical protein AB0B45_50120 [Nonomuraea sp. NPDC049152]|uniref:hypothetical protein n=1 Tax=Nonomuraea sp. NPDC049152 TaxID=3154350 RepID=UPI0033DEE7A3
MRKAPLIGVMAVALAGCGMLPPITLPTGEARPSAAGRPSSPATPPPSPSPSPVPTAGVLTIADAKRAAAGWLATYNRTIRNRSWWNDPALIDKLFWDGTRHEAAIDRWAVEEDGDKSKIRKPIRLTGQTYYVPREQTMSDGQWFLLKATYAGQDRAHVLAFWRAEGGEFRLAAKTPLHYGRRMPEPQRDAEGYVTAMPGAIGRIVAQEYMVFWDYDIHEQEGRNGYRLAKDNYSRIAYRTVSKGIYMGYHSHSRPYGFRTTDGGSFHIFSLLNDPKSVTAVLTVGVSMRGNSKVIQETAGDWYS